MKKYLKKQILIVKNVVIFVMPTVQYSVITKMVAGLLVEIIVLSARKNVMFQSII